MTELDALYDAVFAAPDDEAPRQVLADALMEQGDPRGEFIALQLQSPRSQRSERRMQKLLERHRTSFLRGLEPMVLQPNPQSWERGFLTEASLLLEGLSFDVPDLATLRRVEVLSTPAVPTELASPHMRSLREVTIAPVSAIPVLFAADRPLPLETVGLSGPGDPRFWPDAMAEVIGAARSLPRLTQLVLHLNRSNVDEAGWIWKMPVLRQLKTLAFEGSFRGVPLHAVLPLLRDLPSPPTAVEFRGTGLSLRLRGAGFRVLDVTLEPPPGALVLCSMIDLLPADALDDLTVETTTPLEPTLVGSLRSAVRRLSLTNVVLPSAHSRMK